MELGALFYGLDIADGPVSMVCHRARLLGREAMISQGSALAIPYPDNTFDFVVTIGCLHHTGDLARALLEVYRVLKSGKRSTIMLYNALSYRQWLRRPIQVYRRMKTPTFDWSNAEENLRRVYDSNKKWMAAPSTTFISPEEARSFLLKLFRSVRVSPHNIGHDFWPSRAMSRSLADTCFARYMGLDLYIDCIK
jgi:ubiquinone/menaquinone biosynthesis C-methylase UbiE